MFALAKFVSVVCPLGATVAGIDWVRSIRSSLSISSIRVWGSIKCAGVDVEVFSVCTGVLAIDASRFEIGLTVRVDIELESVGLRKIHRPASKIVGTECGKAGG
jgi:hypothetical protein